jgi:hypothetical protein
MFQNKRNAKSASIGANDHSLSLILQYINRKILLFYIFIISMIEKLLKKT